MKRAIVFLAEGFEEIEAFSIVDVLRRAGIDLQTLSISDDYFVTGAHHIQVKADNILSKSDCADADILILPGGMPGSLHLGQSETLRTLLQGHYAKGKLLAAICAAPMVFGHLGLLQGKNATCFPGREPDLLGANITNKRVVVAGNVITGIAAGAAIEFALKLVEILIGKEAADKVSKAMIVK